MNNIVQRPNNPIASPQGAPAIIPKFDNPVFNGELGPSIIHPDLQHLVLVTGFRGMGKTSFGLKVDNPNNMLVITSESKTGALAHQLNVGAYFSVVDEVMDKYGDKFDLQAVYDRTFQIVNSIPQGRFTTLFLDNAADLQDGAAQFIKNNPSIAIKYGVKPENAITGAYGGAWPGVKHLIRNLLHLARSKGVKVIVASFQLKGAWQNGKPLFDKFKMTDVSTWHEESNLTLVLVEPLPRFAPVPRALVMKEQLSLLQWDPETQSHKQVRRLPYALPKAEPSEVYRYLREPASFKDLKEGEKVTAEELWPFGPTFGKEQLATLERISRVQEKLGLTINNEEE